MKPPFLKPILAPEQKCRWFHKQQNITWRTHPKTTFLSGTSLGTVHRSSSFEGTWFLKHLFPAITDSIVAPEDGVLIVDSEASSLPKAKALGQYLPLGQCRALAELLSRHEIFVAEYQAPSDDLSQHVRPDALVKEIDRQALKVRALERKKRRLLRQIKRGKKDASLTAFQIKQRIASDARRIMDSPIESLIPVILRRFSEISTVSVEEKAFCHQTYERVKSLFSEGCSVPFDDLLSIHEEFQLLSEFDRNFRLYDKKMLAVAQNPAFSESVRTDRLAEWQDWREKFVTDVFDGEA